MQSEFDARRAATWLATGWRPVAGLMALAAVLRSVGIGNQLWLDEISALKSIGRTPGEVLTQWPGASSHVFFEFLASLSVSLFGEGPFAIRLPAAVFGVGGVAVVYVFATRLLTRGAAFFAGALFAVSYHHIFYSQNARGYTALIFFAMLGADALMRMHEARRIEVRTGILYVIAGALAGYSNLLGVFVVVGHALAVLGATAIAKWRNREEPVPLWPYLACAFAAGSVVLLLYLPLIGSVLEYTRSNVENPGEGPRVSLWLLAVLVEGLSAAFMGPLGLAAAAAIGLVGFVDWARRRPFALAVLILPVVVQFTAMVVLGAGIYPRYFAVALPAAFLVGGTGVYLAVNAFTRVALRAASARVVVARALLVLAVVASAAPLRRYYRMPKQDYLGAMAEVDQLAGAQDTKVGVHLAGHIIIDHYGQPYASVETHADLLALEGRGGRLWLVTTLERLLDVHDAELANHIRTHYRLVKEIPGTVGDGAMRIYGRPQ